MTCPLARPRRWVLTWVYAAQDDPPSPSTTVAIAGLDVVQAAAAAAVAGHDEVLVVGPAGAGKTKMLAAALADLTEQHRAVFGVAPTAKAARVLEAESRASRMYVTVVAPA